ncbi:hypothetical protein H9Q72_006153 [Fusarium xylarioides]|uniref:Uncharacterized protein n=1 Tax=Fusarium xylarioides TaxID=221167 RepID=A0A9P7HSZ8_9HYPO|nr:hypothetical protein H9Q72_006153 [Fusarium xylarioides]
MPVNTLSLVGAAFLLALQAIILIIELASFPWRKISLSSLIPFSFREGDPNEDEQPSEAQQKKELEQAVINLLKKSRKIQPATEWISHMRQLVAPILISAIGISFATASLANKYDTGQAAIFSLSGSPQSQVVCDNTSLPTVDADIGGEGIRVAVWAQSAALVIITLLGTFQCNALGAKEIGAGLAITHISLAIALIVQMERKTLTSPDAIVGAMLLDAQGSALGIQLMAKEVLAARWQVGIIVGCQTIGAILVPMIVARFESSVFINQDTCFCITAFWWGWITDCPETQNNQTTSFWVYISCRMLGFVQTVFFAIANTGKFHRAEKWNKSLQDISFPELAARHGDPVTNANESGGNEESSTLLYRNYPATVALTYLIHAVFSLTSAAAAHEIMHAGLKPSSNAVSVGQIIAIVVAVATILRAIWLLWRTLSPRRGKYVWPFRLDIASIAWRFSWDRWDRSGVKLHGGFILAGNPDFPLFEENDVSPYKIGAIFSNPRDLQTMFCRPDMPGSSVSSYAAVTCEFHGSGRQATGLRKFRMLFCHHKRTPEAEISLYMDGLEKFFIPDQSNLLLEMLQQPGIEEKVRQESKFNRFYIMTGLQIAEGLKSQLGGDWRPLDGKRVFAYQLREVRIDPRVPGNFNLGLVPRDNLF